MGRRDQVAVAAARTLTAQVDSSRGLLLQNVVLATPLLEGKAGSPARDLVVEIQQQDVSVATEASSRGCGFYGE